MNKSVLLVAFHFPPQAASSGIQRTLSFAKYLGNYGWHPIVLSASAIAYPSKNSSQMEGLPTEVVIKRAFALDAKRHMGFRGRYPNILALPDRWVTWLFGAIPSGLGLIRKYNPAIIWSTYPISTALLIGLILHKVTKKPWVVDFRDPMLQDDYPITKLDRTVYGWLERRVIHHCQIAIFTTEAAMQNYKLRFPEYPNEKFQIIENGYDEEMFSSAVCAATAKCETADKRLTLLHSGALYSKGRNPSCFFEAVSSLKTAGSLKTSGLRIILRATGNDTYVRELAEKYDITDIVEVAPAISYRDALREMLDVDGLIVFQGSSFNRQIPAKIYEYFRARKPILCLVDPSGETARILLNAGFSGLASVDSPTEIISALEEFLRRIHQNTAHIANEEVIRQSSRENRTAELARVFDQINKH